MKEVGVEKGAQAQLLLLELKLLPAPGRVLRVDYSRPAGCGGPELPSDWEDRGARLLGSCASLGPFRS